VIFFSTRMTSRTRSHRDVRSATSSDHLIDEFPEWASLPLRRVEPTGTDNAIFRLGQPSLTHLLPHPGLGGVSGHGQQIRRHEDDTDTRSLQIAEYRGIRLPTGVRAVPSPPAVTPAARRVAPRPGRRKEGGIVVATGTVKWFSSENGFGFITPEDGSADVSVPFRAISGEGYRNLAENQKVEDDVTQGREGPQATNDARPPGSTT
jgi:CspA family cold shock protein